MKIKKYSVVAHLIHSRIELIRVMIKDVGAIDGHSVVSLNLEYFKKASASVLRDHGLFSEHEDLVQAGELYILSRKRSNMREYYTVEYFGKSITTDDEGVTMIPANSLTKWSFEKAMEMKGKFVTHHKLAGFSIVKRWTVPD